MSQQEAMDVDAPQQAGSASVSAAIPQANGGPPRANGSVTPAPGSKPVPGRPTPEQIALFNAPIALPYRSPVEQRAAPKPAEQPRASPAGGAAKAVPTTVAAALENTPRMFRTGYIYDPIMMLHCQDGYVPTEDHNETGDGHPEDPLRIKRIFGKLATAGLISRMKKLQSRNVDRQEVLLVHTEDHWDKVQMTELLDDEHVQMTKLYYDALSLYVNRQTAVCARLSCGGVIQSCVSVCKQEVRNAFAIVRPPGHHAEPDTPMGFCFYNNAAVAAKVVIAEKLAKKVLILDWDVHHGNGTQRAFWDDPDVLYISIHRHDGGRFYPTSDFGALDQVGGEAAAGTSVNIPWPSAGFGDADYIYAFQKIIMPIAYEFNPDLVIISAGFDAAKGDTLGGCEVTPAAYGHMTHMLCALAGGKVVVALEGGYNLEAISDSALAVAKVLLGETPDELGRLEASEVATEVMYQVAKAQSPYWKSIDVKGCEPPEVGDEVPDALISIPDLLKIHRAHHLYQKHHLFQIPLANPLLEESFSGQIICNEGVYDVGKAGTLVVFVHDFGNLRVETVGVSSTDVHMTNSYLLDTSDAIVDWIQGEGYNLIDVNVLRHLPTQFAPTGPRMIQKSGPALDGQLMTYLWDNYIELTEASNVVLIGHGTGCNAIMDLVNQRDVERKVKAIVQVAGLHSLVRIDPHAAEKRDWFRKANKIYLPATHPILGDEKVQKRLGGQVIASTQERVVSVLNQCLPQIRAFVAGKVPPKQQMPPPSDRPAADIQMAPVASAAA